MRASTSGSTAEVASSITSSRGRRTSARASDSRCRWPPDSVRAALPQPGVEAVGQRGDEAVGLRGPQRRPHLVVGHVGAERDVAAHGVVEQERLLRHQRDVLGERAGREVAQVVPVEQHLPVDRVDEPQQQRGQRALAAGRGADHGDGAAGLDGEGQVRPAAPGRRRSGRTGRARRDGRPSRRGRSRCAPYAISPVASSTALHPVEADDAARELADQPAERADREGHDRQQVGDRDDVAGVGQRRCSTRTTPTASTASTPRLGSASSTGSKAARIRPARMLTSRSWCGLVRRTARSPRSRGPGS